MANVTEYLAPIKIVYTTDYSGDLLHPLIINSVDELIEITPVAFDGEPTTENLNALPDNCKIKVKETGIYVLCIATNGYGTCAAEVGVSLFPCYVTEYKNLNFKYSDTNGIAIALFAGMYDYLCVYKQTDNRGLRMSRLGTYSIRPENSFGSNASYSVSNVQPGDYVAFKVPQESGATVVYNSEEIARLEAGQTATLSCSGKKMTSNVIVSFGSAGSITYNELITEVEAGKTATLQCAGKKMTSDVYIAVQDDGSSVVGTWVFKDVISEDGLKPYNNSPSGKRYYVKFKTNGRNYMIVTYDTLYDSALLNVLTSYSGTYAYSWYGRNGENVWQNDNFKTWVITEEPTDEEFIAWLKANATKTA